MNHKSPGKPTLNCQSRGIPIKPVVKRGLKTLEFYGKWTGQKHKSV